MRGRVFALVDCNNFYVSCERVFNATVRTKPVIVLSNNDGCVVARSNEVKALGVKMGQPAFEIKELIEKHHIVLFSSNYSLYADMSSRVMRVLAEFSEHVETYSIDEAFLELTDLRIDDFTELGREIKRRVLQYTGVPVSVGIAPSKTLTKIACEVVKKDPEYGGVLDICKLSNAQIDEILEKIPVEDVWGIGYQYTKFLRARGVHTARDLKYANPKFIRKHLTVNGERMVLELAGIACHMLEEAIKPKKGIMCSRMFSKDVISREELEEAIATYAARAAEKLRGQNSLTSEISVFIRSNEFKQDLPRYSNFRSVRLPYPTAFTPEIIKYALELLKSMYLEGYHYKKAGVFLSRITSQDVLQPDLFGEFSFERRSKELRLMCIVDAINTAYGRDTLFFAIQGIKRDWKMKQLKLSSRFTTKWSEILIVQV
jgi:DNA polymerase V